MPFGCYACWAGYGAWLHAQEAEPDAAPEVNIAAPDSVVTDSTDAPGDDSAQDGVAQENEAADNPELSEPSPEEQDAGSSASGGTVTLLKIQGAIGPATADFVSRGIESAETAGASLIVLEMDTPGRIGYGHAGDHSSHSRVVHSGYHLRFASGCARRERRNLHPLCKPYRRHGARYESGRRNACRDRRTGPRIARGYR